MKRVNFPIQEGSWVVRKNQVADHGQYGYVDFIDGDQASVLWGWRVGGSFGGIEKLDNLLPIAPPSRVCDFGKKVIVEKLEQFKKKHGASYAYDAATMEIMRFIYQEMYEEDI